MMRAQGATLGIIQCTPSICNLLNGHQSFHFSLPYFTEIINFNDVRHKYIIQGQFSMYICCGGSKGKWVKCLE